MASSARAAEQQDLNPRSRNRTWRSGSRKGHEPRLSLAGLSLRYDEAERRGVFADARIPGNDGDQLWGFAEQF